MSFRISRISATFDDLGREEPLRDLGVVEDRRQRLVQLVGQRRRELAHGRDAADVRHLLPEPLRLELHLPARERVGEDFPEEPELLDQLVRQPRALGADGAEHEAAHDDPADDQGQGHLGLDAAARDSCADPPRPRREARRAWRS